MTSMAALLCHNNNGTNYGPRSPISEYSYNMTLTVNSTEVEFSGGDYRTDTCRHWVVSDNRNLYEYHIINDNNNDNDNNDNHGAFRLEEQNSYRLRGFSGDYEGICFYDEYYSIGNNTTRNNNTKKLAILDERDRTVALCQVPVVASSSIMTTTTTIDLENPDDCVSYSLNEDTLASGTDFADFNPNRGFEGVACDPEGQKLYIVQEKNPMIVWELDLVTGVFDILIPVEDLPPWTDLVQDLAGITFDPIQRTLYVLSEQSELVVESTLEGDIVGPPLNVSIATQPEGIYFANEGRELWIASEPNELLLFRAPSDIVETATMTPSSALSMASMTEASSDLVGMATTTPSSLLSLASTNEPSSD